jgi:AcrR family transcriptional regulator
MSRLRARAAQAPADEASDQNTRSRILAAAMEEFAANGSSGARVEKIARAAHVNIRMIYYFFGSKKGLLNEVLSQIFRERQASLPVEFETAEDLLVSYFDGYARDPDRVRLLLWEALETALPDDVDQLTNLAERKAVVKRRVAAIAELQAKGRLPADLDPKLLYLAFAAMALFPMSFPPSVLVATGADAASPAFRRRYRKFLGELASALAR